MLDEAGIDLHQPALERALRLGDAAPCRHRFGARREDRVGRDPAELLLPGEHALAVGVPAVVELALVLVGPFLVDLVRPMPRARCPVQQEGLVGRECLVAAQPVDAALRQVFAQVVLRVVRWFDDVGVLHQPRLPLRGLAGQKAIEVVEAVTGGPAVERSHRGGLVGRRVVPLADGGRAVAVVAQHFGEGGRSLRYHAGVAVPVHRAFGDGAVAHALVVAPSQQRGAGGRADRRGVEGVVADALVGHAAQRGRLDLAAEGRRASGAAARRGACAPSPAAAALRCWPRVPAGRAAPSRPTARPPCRPRGLQSRRARSRTGSGSQSDEAAVSSHPHSNQERNVRQHPRQFAPAHAAVRRRHASIDHVLHVWCPAPIAD